MVREQTVKAVLTVVPKLSDRIVNGELLRYLAKTANDEQAGIRTNTTICLGKIARNLGSNVCLLSRVRYLGSTDNVLESSKGALGSIFQIRSEERRVGKECPV